MNNLFCPFIHKFVLVFFNDILVYSKNFDEHLEHLDRFLCTLQQGEFYLKWPKYAFGKQYTNYLGHIMSANGVELEPTKIQPMQDWPIPTSLKSLNGFLGLTIFYQYFIKD